MTQPPAPDLDPNLALAQRQLALLGELADMAMATARAFAASAIASARAEEMILAEECFTPEVGRAKACGARDGAESFQKASRAVRLTFMLQMNLAEIVRDIRAGHVTYLGSLRGVWERRLSAFPHRRHPAHIRASPLGVVAWSCPTAQVADQPLTWLCS